ncbi:MAG: P-II family nitrogen regulator [Methanothrix sp.]|jgi:nitrogen regulatory protein PII|nr:P-II family nitrogen regulator [Methanothrix sp.]
MKCEENDLFLIVTIARKGWGDAVLDASKKAGAEGGTVVFGRGCGIHENKTLLGMMIEPEKEIVLTVVPKAIADKVLDAVVAGAELEEPGNGMALVLPIAKVAGRVHMLEKS